MQNGSFQSVKLFKIFYHWIIVNGALLYIIIGSILILQLVEI